MCVIDILLSLFLKENIGRKNITYLKLDLSTINAPATQMSTVNEVLNQSLSIMRGLGLTKIVCVFDQAFYAKILEIINMLTSSRVSSSGLAYFTPSAHCWQ